MNEERISKRCKVRRLGWQENERKREKNRCAERERERERERESTDIYAQHQKLLTQPSGKLFLGDGGRCG